MIPHAGRDQCLQAADPCNTVAQHPHPQRPVMAGQRRAGEVVEASRTRLAAVALPVGLPVVAAVPDHAAPPHAGQRTPSGQRCWRTKAKHLASSISAERLTRSGAAMTPGSSRGPVAYPVPRPPSQPAFRRATQPRAITPDPNKSLPVLVATTTDGVRQVRASMAPMPTSRPSAAVKLRSRGAGRRRRRA